MNYGQNIDLHGEVNQLAKNRICDAFLQKLISGEVTVTDEDKA